MHISPTHTTSRTEDPREDTRTNDPKEDPKEDLITDDPRRILKRILKKTHSAAALLICQLVTYSDSAGVLSCICNIAKSHIIHTFVFD